jgi:O-antigen/teichoic acid export membrane protein
MLPAYSKVLQTQASRLRDAVYRSRLGLDALLILPVGALMVLSNWVIEFLYDPRYHEAGWMLQIICVRVLMTPSLTNSETCLIALGRSKYTFVQNVCRSIWMLACIPLGWSLAGMQGIVWAVALSELPVMVVLWTGLIRNKMFLPIAELRSVLFAAIGALLGFAIKYLFDLN